MMVPLQNEYICVRATFSLHVCVSLFEHICAEGSRAKGCGVAVVEIFERRKLTCFLERKAFLMALQFYFIFVIGAEKHGWISGDNLQESL